MILAAAGKRINASSPPARLFDVRLVEPEDYKPDMQNFD